MTPEVAAALARLEQSASAVCNVTTGAFLGSLAPDVALVRQEIARLEITQADYGALAAALRQVRTAIGYLPHRVLAMYIPVDVLAALRPPPPGAPSGEAT